MSMILAESVIYDITERLQHDIYLFCLGCMLTSVNYVIRCVTLVSDHVVGSVYRKSAEFGPQSTMGCCRGVPTCLRSHADETVTGESNPSCWTRRPRSFMCSRASLV